MIVGVLVVAWTIHTQGQLLLWSSLITGPMPCEVRCTGNHGRSSFSIDPLSFTIPRYQSTREGGREGDRRGIERERDRGRDRVRKNMAIEVYESGRGGKCLYMLRYLYSWSKEMKLQIAEKHFDIHIGKSMCTSRDTYFILKLKTEVWNMKQNVRQARQ